METKLFEFTTQEENDIKEVIAEVSQIMCTLVSEGVSSAEGSNITTLDLIKNIIGFERGRELDFLRVSVVESNGRITIHPQNGEISKKSVTFLESVITAQLEYFEREIPKAVTFLNLKFGQTLINKGTDIHNLESNQYLEGKAL